MLPMRERFPVRASSALIVIVALVSGLGGCAERTPVDGSAPRSGRGGLELQAVLSGSEGYARALHPMAFRFPRDHASHDDYRSEWWYLTANLHDESGRRWGVQFTVFRQAIVPPAAIDVSTRTESPTDSRWRTGQLYLAHFALTDAGARQHQAFERAGRGAMGLAGTEARPFRVWVDGWSLESEGETFMPLRLDVRTPGGLNLVLNLNATKPMVLQGDAGFSTKGDEPGNASYYYAFTRLEAAGTLERDGESVALTGTAWMDREWSTSVLGPEHAGWDWFSLQLSDGQELMVYRLRRRDGTRDPYDAGTWVDLDGSSAHLETGDFQLTPLDFWIDERGVGWPVRWQLVLAGRGLTLEIEPVMSDQLMRTTLRYWEGAVNVSGSLRGVGYMELTGYGDGP